MSFTVAGAPWTLTLPKNDLKLQQRQLKPDGSSAYFSLVDEKHKITMSFFIEPVDECKDSKACRDMVWKLGNPSWENPQNVVQAEIDGVSYSPPSVATLVNNKPLFLPTGVRAIR